MKTRLFIAAAMSCTMVAFSQKNELKTAEKALKSGSAAEAKTALESASSLIGGADDKMKAQYHFLKGETFAMLAKKGDASAFNTAIESYKEAIATEEASGKAKYTVESKQKLSGMTADLINAAVEDNNNKQYKPAAEKLYMGYQLRPKDTVYLYYAASSAVNGGEYEQALTY